MFVRYSSFSRLLIIYVCGIALWLTSSKGLPAPNTEDRQGSGSYEPVIVVYHNERTVAKVEYLDTTRTKIQKCNLSEIDSENDTEEVLSSFRQHVEEVSFPIMLWFIEECRMLDFIDETSNIKTDATSLELSVLPSWSLFSGILPGTRWCGTGDVAKQYDDLGRYNNVDICCRAHDHCPIKVKGLQTGYGIFNWSFYTKSHCDCDREFKKCLKISRSRVADLMGNFYFNVLKVQCLQEDTRVCRKQLRSRCAETKQNIKMKAVESEWQY
ncbi:uncharacterized protein LOC111085211 [Limulus polyphemus]|uniref:Uncharacterized protein LOC111085211 n=1 Tax=Limulus polyphemus TaxID=6850 RepID=A0ABM1S4C3_LIMPO|nr:uncharacterized protein LOC111085211 [Limulus polyphemus]